MELAQDQVPPKKVMSLLPTKGSRFTLSSEQTNGGIGGFRASTTTSIRSVSPSKRWPIRSRSQDRNFLRRSLIFEEGGTTVIPENGVPHIPRLPFTRRGLEGNSNEASALENGHHTHRPNVRSRRSPFRNEVTSSRSSVSSRESSQESLDHFQNVHTENGARSQAPSGGPSRHIRGRKSRSICQKARLWETKENEAEKQSSNAFSTLPWSTKFSQRRQPLKRTCSSPSLADMEPSALKVEPSLDQGSMTVAQDIVAFFNAEVPPNDRRKTLKRASTANLEGSILRRRSLSPLDEEDHHSPTHGTSCSPQNGPVDAVINSPQAEEDCEGNVITEEGIHTQEPHSVSQSPPGTWNQGHSSVRLVTRQNAFDTNSFARKEIREAKQTSEPPPTGIFLTSFADEAEHEVGQQEGSCQILSSLQQEKAQLVDDSLKSEAESGGEATKTLLVGAEKEGEARVEIQRESSQLGVEETYGPTSLAESDLRELIKSPTASGDRAGKKVTRSSSVGEHETGVEDKLAEPGVEIQRETKCVVEFPPENAVECAPHNPELDETALFAALSETGDVPHSRVVTPGDARVEFEEIPGTPSESDSGETPRVRIDEIDRPFGVPNFLVIQELESGALEESPLPSPEVKCDIRIEITLCEDLEDPLGDEDWEAPTRSTTPEHFEVSDDDDDDDRSFDLSASQSNILDQDLDLEVLRDEDLDLVTLSDPASSCEDSSEDEFEALRRLRLRRGDHREAPPDRDIVEEDTETAEFQLRLRKLSHTSSPTLGGSFLEETVHRSRSEEENNWADVEEDFFEQLRTNRCLERRTSEAPEREIEPDDRDTAELQTTLRRSKSNEIFNRRKKSRGSLNPVKRNSLGLEILVEQVPKEDEDQSSLDVNIPIPECVEQPNGDEDAKEDDEPVEETPARPSCLFKSLSAGSDLDKLRAISELNGRIQSLVDLSVLKPGRQPVSSTLSPRSQEREVCNSSPITASVWSIHKLAQGVETLKDKLTSHPGLFFPAPQDKAMNRIGTSLSPPGDGLDSKGDVSTSASPRRIHKSGLTRSHSWQGFGSKEIKRQLRQHAFFDSGRYEQVSSAQLDLPPPPQAPPLRGGAQVAGGGTKAARRYRPLSHSPKRSRSSRPSTVEEELEREPSPVQGKGGRRRSRRQHESAKWSEEEEDYGKDAPSYQCVVTCSVKPTEKALSVQAQKNFIIFSKRMEELRCQIVQARPELSPEQVHEILATVTQRHDQKTKGNGSPLPSDEELQEFLDYIGQGVLNEERIQYEERKKREREEHDPDEDPEQAMKRNKSANQYFYRQHYLSIIQEEEEAENGTPTNSRPPSSCGLPKGVNLKQALRDMKTEAIAESKERSRPKNYDSWGSEISEDSLISVNSILSDELISPSLSSERSPKPLGSLNDLLDKVPMPPPEFLELGRNSSSSSSNSVSTRADSRCSSAISSEFIKDLPHDDSPEATSDLKPASRNGEMKAKSIFHLSGVRDKLKHAIQPAKEGPEFESGASGTKNSPDASPGSKVGRFFRSLSRKSSTEESESEDRAKKEEQKSRRGSNSSLSDKVKMIAARRDFFSNPSTPRDSEVIGCSDNPEWCESVESADNHPERRIGNNELSVSPGAVKALEVGLQADVPQVHQPPFATSTEVRQCAKASHHTQAVNVEDMYRKIDKASKRKSNPKWADLSIASLISECEDYVKTEEFTHDLSSKILQMFETEENQLEPVYSNVPQLADHYSEVQIPPPPPPMRLGRPHANYCTLEPHYARPVDYQGNIYEQIDHANASDTKTPPQKPERTVSHSLPQFPQLRDSLYDNEVGSKAGSGTTQETQKLPPECSTDELVRLNPHETSPLSSLPSEHSSSTQDSAYESENKTQSSNTDPKQCPPRPDPPKVYSHSEYEVLDDEGLPQDWDHYEELDITPVPVPPQFQDVQWSKVGKTTNANFFESDDVFSTIKRNPNFKVDVVPPLVPIRESSKRLRTPHQDQFASLPRSLERLASFQSSDAIQTKTPAYEDVVNPIASVFEDLNEYLSDSDGMLSLDYKIAVQKRKKKLKLLAQKYQDDLEVDIFAHPRREDQSEELPSGTTKSVDNQDWERFADNGMETGPTKEVDDTSGPRVKQVVEQIQRKYPSVLERTRMRRSPSVVSECSTLEPIPEERTGQVYAARVTKPINVPNPQFHSLPRSNRGFQSNLVGVRENVVEPNGLSHAAMFEQSIRNKRLEPVEQAGSLKNRKAARTASLNSLLFKESSSVKSNRDPSSLFCSTFKENGLGMSSSNQELSRTFGSTASLGPVSPQRVDQATKNQWTKQWVSELSLNRSWTPNQVLIKECSCGNKVQFDPMEESSTQGYSTETEAGPNAGYTASDYSTFDPRRAGTNEGLFHARMTEVFHGSEPGSVPPPRPPPPSLTSTLPRPLKRSQSLNSGFSKRLPEWNAYLPLSQH